ncbi:Glucose/arabinose dehydrogenase, beta-propeller fold [Alteribacillus persepolensis]|uniref:Glucose/arabinose dehydrogenase, beta-propeller fold n=1 Tax=Alteribacillus persepolensis TaxID=568899 RepID=A0A1G8C3N3_9BACI|nr:PQQ-dependent sugar dehydrogenase [Alteribacillus persepolensis]SDH40107.1 Glucose/arabinose dehydrogenase, beta-propeller fold [Alteribacillus persepolensis]
MQKKILFSFLFVLLSGCAFSDNGKTETEDTSPDTQTPDNKQDDMHNAETIATGLNVPWSIQRQNDVFFISERGGTIAAIDSNGTVTRSSVELEKDVISTGEGGLLGFVLDPDFHQNQTAYIYHTYRENNRLFNRIAAIKKTDTQWSEQFVLLEEIPGAEIHNGGRLQIGPDGMLYATAGDANQAHEAQNQQNLAGSILRLDTNGDIPEDNPMPSSYIYSYGHRNPQGLSWDNNTLYSSEHGPSGRDEINRIEPGENYGWPIITGDESQENAKTPLFHSGNDTWAPAGSTFHEGQLYVTGLRGNQLMQFSIPEGSMEMIYKDNDRLRDVYADDTYLYVITNNRDGRGNPGQEDDRLIRIPLSLNTTSRH